MLGHICPVLKDQIGQICPFLSELAHGRAQPLTPDRRRSRPGTAGRSRRPQGFPAPGRRTCPCPRHPSASRAPSGCSRRWCRDPCRGCRACRRGARRATHSAPRTRPGRPAARRWPVPSGSRALRRRRAPHPPPLTPPRYTVDGSTDSYAVECSTDSYAVECSTDSYAVECSTDSYAVECSTDSYAVECSTDSYAVECSTDSYAVECSTDSTCSSSMSKLVSARAPTACAKRASLLRDTLSVMCRPPASASPNIIARLLPHTWA